MVLYCILAGAIILFGSKRKVTVPAKDLHGFIHVDYKGFESAFPIPIRPTDLRRDCSKKIMTEI
jgi:hypothetical protein